jgi:hypothetical protein
MGFTNVGLLALAGKNLPVLVSKNQTINQVWFVELEHDFSKELGYQFYWSVEVWNQK